MKFLFSLISLSVLLHFSPQTVKSQSDQGIVEIKLNDIQAIKNGEEVSGYYLFYKTEQEKGKDVIYHLEILDEEANKVAGNNILGSKDLHLIDVASSGKLMAFKFFDMKKDLLVIKFYNLQAEEVNTVQYELDKNQQRMMKMSIEQPMYKQPSFFAVGDQGFVNIRQILKGMRFGYEADFYNNQGEKVWRSKSDMDDKGSHTLRYVGSAADMIYAIRSKGKNKDLESRIVGLSITNGMEKFESDKLELLSDERMVINFFFNEEENEMYSLGIYQEKKDQGIVFTSYDMQGAVKEESMINWKSEVGDLEKRGSIYFHDISKQANGSYLAVGEHYQLNSRLVIGDLFLFELDENLQLKQVEKFEKEENKYEVGTGAALIGGASGMTMAIMGYISNSMGWFDFSHAYTDASANYRAYYANNTKTNGKGDNIIGSVYPEGGDYKLNKEVIQSGADKVKMLPARDGQLLLFEYFDKEEELRHRFLEMK